MRPPVQWLFAADPPSNLAEGLGNDMQRGDLIPRRWNKNQRRWSKDRAMKKEEDEMNLLKVFRKVQNRGKLGENLPSDELQRGTVTMWAAAKSFGFIGVGTPLDIFFHAGALSGDEWIENGRKNALVGDKVEFRTAPGRKGLKAISVRLVHRVRERVG